jgi:cell wall assembly regulator SMI1
MTPKELIQQFSNTLELRPGLSESQIADFQNGMGVALPPEIRDLLRYSVGFDLHTKSKRSSEAPVRFTGNPGFAFEETFPKSVPVLPDGVGNYWVVDINANTGKWDCVFFACHDPPRSCDCCAKSTCFSYATIEIQRRHCLLGVL